FFPIAAPNWSCPTIDRDLPFPAWIWKGLHIDLIALGLVRSVGQPLPIRRQLRLPFVARHLQIRKGFSIAEERQNPNIGPGLGVEHALDDVSTVRRPVGWTNVLISRRAAGSLQNFVLGGAARRLCEQPDARAD